MKNSRKTLKLHELGRVKVILPVKGMRIFFPCVKDNAQTTSPPPQSTLTPST